MNSIDIILALIIIIAFYSGFKKGLFVTLTSLIGLIAGVFGAIHFSGFAASFISNRFDWGPQTTQLTAFAVTFLGIVIIISMAGKFLTKIADFAALGLINKILGGLFCVIQYTFITSIVFMFINASSSISGYFISEERKEKSILYKPIESIAPLIVPHIIKNVKILNKEEEKESHSA